MWKTLALVMMAMAAVDILSGLAAQADDAQNSVAVASAVPTADQGPLSGGVNQNDMSPPSDPPAGEVQPHQSGDIVYITGGIGDEEKNAMEALQKNYNLRIISVEKTGAFAGATHIVISDRRGDVLLNISADPLFYAQLPTGHYTLQASHDGLSQQKKISISHGDAAIVRLNW